MENKKIALITGVTKNIGRAICRIYFKNGFQIIGTYRNGLDSFEAQLEFKKEFPGSKLYKVDFCNQDNVTDFINTIKKEKLKIDVLINNAGMVNFTNDKIKNEFLNFDVESFQQVFNCNLITTARLSIELKENINENGNIIIISSGACLHGAYATISYNASKAALINLMESLANNYYRYKKIRVNAVAPGWIDSEGSTMGADEESSYMKRVATVTPMQRNGKPEEVANAVYFLTSQNASFITGSTIFVDGGYKNHNVNYLEEAEYATFSLNLKHE